MSTCDLSIVIPCFNEEKNIPLLAAEIHKECSHLNLNYEILFVDDGSLDSTLGVLKEISATDQRISFLSLKHNYGHQTALTIGIKASRGKVVIAMDADFQHSPGYLPKMYDLWVATSCDVIQTKRMDYSPFESFLKKTLSRLFYSFAKNLFSGQLVEGGADFRLIGPKVIGDIKDCPRTSIFHRGFCARPLYSHTILEIDVKERLYGMSRYTLSKQLQLAFMGIIELLELNNKLRIGFKAVEISEHHFDERIKSEIKKVA